MVPVYLASVESSVADGYACLFLWALERRKGEVNEDSVLCLFIHDLRFGCLNQAYI